jgi:hypothetical protein
LPGIGHVRLVCDSADTSLRHRLGLDPVARFYR